MFIENLKSVLGPVPSALRGCHVKVTYVPYLIVWVCVIMFMLHFFTLNIEVTWWVCGITNHLKMRYKMWYYAHFTKIISKEDKMTNKVGANV